MLDLGKYACAGERFTLVEEGERLLELCGRVQYGYKADCRRDAPEICSVAPLCQSIMLKGAAASYIPSDWRRVSKHVLTWHLQTHQLVGHCLVGCEELVVAVELARPRQRATGASSAIAGDVTRVTVRRFTSAFMLIV